MMMTDPTNPDRAKATESRDGSESPLADDTGLCLGLRFIDDERFNCYLRNGHGGACKYESAPASKPPLAERDTECPRCLEKFPQDKMHEGPDRNLWCEPCLDGYRGYAAPIRKPTEPPLAERVDDLSELERAALTDAASDIAKRILEAAAEDG